jgi:hypothetical protein
LSAADVDAAWTIQIDSSGFRAVNGEHPATLALTGPATDLYLLLWNRTGVDRLDARGDLRVLTRWRASATVNWT